MVMAYPALVQPGEKMQRKIRSPVHQWYIRQLPWGIHPFMIAPVLPGDTLKSLQFQSRVVTEPLTNPLIGFWIEYYFFYVKITDIAEVDCTGMFLDPSFDASAIITAQGGTTASKFYYHGGGAGLINWPRLCLRRVVEEYFREEGEVWNSVFLTSGGENIPLAGLNINNWADSLTMQDTFTAEDFDVEGPDVNTTIQASEVDDAMRRWYFERMYGGLTNMRYEDWVASYGVKVPEVQESLKRPELLRYVKEWTYPTNTVDPANGTPRSACSWSVAERADKDRFFKEPGFIFGVSVCRPKAYFGNQTGAATMAMIQQQAWLPPWAKDDPYKSFMKMPAAGGPVPAITDADGYWFDVKDLFAYGDQWWYSPAVAPDKFHNVASPASNAARGYVPATADVDALFVTARAAFDYIRQDGVCTLRLASTADPDPFMTRPIT